MRVASRIVYLILYTFTARFGLVSRANYVLHVIEDVPDCS